MEPFSDFLDVLKQIDDPRRAEGKLYDVPHIVLLMLFAMLAGANAYRQTHTFMRVHFDRLRDLLGLKWKKAPAYTSIRGIVTKLDPSSLERVLRRHAAALAARTEPNGASPRHIAIDGKALRHSFDHFTDRKAAHILGAFATDPSLVLGHIECDEKSNEIPALQRLLAESASKARSSPPTPCIVKKRSQPAASCGHGNRCRLFWPRKGAVDECLVARDPAKKN